MNTIETKKRVLWHLLMTVSTAYNAALKYSDPFSRVRVFDHAELSGQFAMAYYIDVIPETIKTKHTHSAIATADEYSAMYNDILSLYVECGGDREFAPKL